VSPRILADENIDADLVLGLQRRVDGIDIVRVQDVGLRTTDDATILQWAADQARVLISRDIKTIPSFAAERIAEGVPMDGVIVLPPSVSMAIAIDDIALIAAATDASEWKSRIAYLPLR
jgi:hypothetical protein